MEMSKIVKRKPHQIEKTGRVNIEEFTHLVAGELGQYVMHNAGLFLQLWIGINGTGQFLRNEMISIYFRRILGMVSPERTSIKSTVI